jgi:DNA-binding transcriptional ArsR family regulator
LAIVASDNSRSDVVDRERDAAFADALDEAARVLVRLSARLRALGEGDRAADRAAAPPPPAPSARSAGRPAQRQRLGERQMAVLALGGLADEHGLTAGEVAKALGYAPANATNLLKRLEDLEYLTRVPDERPARWRRSTVAGG